VRMALAVMAGSALGWGWYRLVGCSSGTCPITSNPWSSTAYGALVAGLLAANW